MKYKIIVFILIIFISISLVSCITLEGRLDKLENMYSEEFRVYIESLGNEEYLEELVKDEGRVEEEYKNFIEVAESLSEAERKYEKGFVDIFRNIEDRQRIMELVNNDNTMELLHDVYSWKSLWVQPIVLSYYSTDQINMIIRTIQEMKDNDPLREKYLSFMTNTDINQKYSFISLEDWSKLYLLFYNKSYEIGKIDKFISTLKSIDIEEIEMVDIYETVNFDIKLEEVRDIYEEDFINQLLLLEDEDYLQAILNNNEALDSCQDFYNWGRLNDIILKKYSIDFLILLDETVKPLNESKRDLYINLVINDRNDKAVNINFSHSEDISDASSALMNMPFYIHKIDTITLSNFNLDTADPNHDRFVNGDDPLAKGSDFHKLFLENYNQIERGNYTKKDFLDFLEEQLKRDDIGTYYINFNGHSDKYLEVHYNGGSWETIWPKEIMDIINENAKNKIINITFEGCSSAKMLDIISNNNLMSEDVEYRNIIGSSYTTTLWDLFPKPYILASIDREQGFLSRKEMISFDELVSFGKGEGATFYDEGLGYVQNLGKTIMKFAFYDWLSPPDYPYEIEYSDEITFNTQYLFCIWYNLYDPKRITNTNLADDFAPLIIITPGEDGFFKN